MSNIMIFKICYPLIAQICSLKAALLSVERQSASGRSNSAPNTLEELSESMQHMVIPASSMRFSARSTASSIIFGGLHSSVAR